MRTIKAALTKLKNQIENQLDLTEEFLPGLPYSIIIKEISLLHPLIEKIEEIDNTLEIIYLKRYCQKCISILQNSYKIKDRSERDNLLLVSALIKLRRHIKETYLIEVKGELRSEAQLQRIEKEIDFMQESLQRYIDLDEKLTQFEQLKASLEGHLSSYKEQASNAQDIAKWHKSSQSSKDKINQYVDLASKNTAQISNLAATARQDEPVLQEYKKGN